MVSKLSSLVTLALLASYPTNAVSSTTCANQYALLPRLLVPSRFTLISNETAIDYPELLWSLDSFLGDIPTGAELTITVKPGGAFSGGYADYVKHSISLEPGQKLSYQSHAAVLSHEVGHQALEQLLQLSPLEGISLNSFRQEAAANLEKIQSSPVYLERKAQREQIMHTKGILAKQPKPSDPRAEKNRRHQLKTLERKSAALQRQMNQLELSSAKVRQLRALHKIMESYHEAFADMTAVLFTGDPRAIRRSLQMPGEPALPTPSPPADFYNFSHRDFTVVESFRDWHLPEGSHRSGAYVLFYPTRSASWLLLMSKLDANEKPKFLKAVARAIGRHVGERQAEWLPEQTSKAPRIDHLNRRFFRLIVEEARREGLLKPKKSS